MAKTELLELVEDALGALLGRFLFGVNDELRAGGRLVRIRDSGELLDLPRERLDVEALDVTPRTLLDRSLDVHLDKGTELLDQPARLPAGLLVRRDRGHEHGRA